MGVDTVREQHLTIHLKISFPSLPCQGVAVCYCKALSMVCFSLRASPFVQIGHKSELPMSARPAAGVKLRMPSHPRFLKADMLVAQL